MFNSPQQREGTNGAGRHRGARFVLVVVVFSACGAGAFGGQAVTEVARISNSLPDVPEPQTPSSAPTAKANPCPGSDRYAGVQANGFRFRVDAESALAGPSGAGVHPAPVPCEKKPLNAFERFMNGPKDRPLTAREKGWLAARNVADPFNLITIGGEAAISVGSDSHSPYGPGMPGYGRYVGVSFTQDLTGEFFGTFLIPSVVHQDPHYHRMEGKRIPRRIGHAIAQVFWTESDYGNGMPNYANLVGFAIDDEIGNLYVPGRRTDLGASAERYATGLATAPLDNFVNEFLPDVASHIHVQIVILQRLINKVARPEMTNGAGPADGIFSF